MGWLKPLFRGSSSRKITLRHPLIIENPKIAFLNLVGAAASPLIAEDMGALKPLFSDYAESNRDVPRCDVLMIYATINADGLIEDSAYCLREIIGESQAPIVIVATENSGKSYIAAGRRPGSSNANLVMTLQRNGGCFPDFFKALFGMMRNGTTMPMAWVKLAPQIPTEQKNVPGTIFAAEVSHILFK